MQNRRRKGGKVADVEKPFSTFRYLARHEIGMNEKQMMLKWQKSLQGITHVGGTMKTKVANGKTTHFHIELRRVNKFIKNLPI